jgi:hypothetical protein
MGAGEPALVIEKYISNFHATYDDLTEEVQKAMNALVAERLQEWFAHLDGEPEAAKALEKLESGQNFSPWFAMQGRNPPGAPKFDWPKNNDERLGMQLLLFRSMARGDISAGVLGKMYLPGSGRNINDNSRAFIDQYFRPMSKELLRYLRRVGEVRAETEAPAADKGVSRQIVEVSGDFANFRAVYDDLTQEVMRSNVQFLADHLANWFRTLDMTSGVASKIQELQAGVDFASWKAEMEASMQVERQLSWPKGPEQRLAMQLMLFRSAAESGSGDSIAGYGWHFIPTGDNNFNNSARRFIDQVFRPMAAELRRYLEKQALAVPASDRIVTLNHNSPDYQHLMSALETLEEVLRGSNDYQDAEEQERVVAEISAGRRLLQAAKARVTAIAALVRDPATYLARQFIGKAVGDAAQVVIDFVMKLFWNIL